MLRIPHLLSIPWKHAKSEAAHLNLSLGANQKTASHPTKRALLHRQNYLPDVLPVMDVPMRGRSLIQRENLSDHWFDFPRAVHPKNLVQLTAQHRRPRLQRTKVDADH